MLIYNLDVGSWILLLRQNTKYTFYLQSSHSLELAFTSWNGKIVHVCWYNIEIEQEWFMTICLALFCLIYIYCHSAEWKKTFSVMKKKTFADNDSGKAKNPKWHSRPQAPFSLFMQTKIQINLFIWPKLIIVFKYFLHFFVKWIAN